MPTLAIQHACGKSTAHPHSELQASVPAESTQRLIFAEKIAESDGAYHVCMRQGAVSWLQRADKAIKVIAVFKHCLLTH